MPEKSSPQKSIQISLLPGEYDQLLHDYIEILEKMDPNPYELSIKKRLIGWFDIRGQINYVRSPHISNFVKSPNTLEQELPGASAMLERLSELDNDSLRTLSEMNSMNLGRLRRRSVTEAIVPGVAFIGGVLGLLPALQSIFPIAIDDPIFSWFPQITISLLLKVLITISLLLGIGNRMVTVPRIGIVDALGGILNIVITYRSGKG
jgi:hypothetical protein